MANKNMFLYWGSGSGPCVRVIAVLMEKGLWEGCPNKMIEFSKKEHKSDEVLKLNPRGQVPTFKDGNIVVNESVAICLYLENEYSTDENRLIPLERAERARVLQKLFELKNLDSCVAEPIIRYKYRKTKEELDEKYLKEKYKAADEELKMWEQCVTNEKYLVGGKFSMADMFLYTELAFFQRFGLKLEKYPALKEFYDFHKTRPSLQASTPPHWASSPGLDFLVDLN